MFQKFEGKDEVLFPGVDDSERVQKMLAQALAVLKASDHENSTD